MSQAHAVPPEPLAPWVEILPNVPPMTDDDLLALQLDTLRLRLLKIGGCVRELLTRVRSS